MSAWWWLAAVAAVFSAAIVWCTLRPWAPCRCCRGERTHRDPRTRRFVGHCTTCRGWGTEERPMRRTLRALTGGRLFPHPPERDIPGQTFAGQLPFAGGGRRPRRKRPPIARRSPGQPGRT